MNNKNGRFDDHKFKKELGQNFISDSNLLEGICRDAKVTSDDVVIEVGAGAGTLTNVLAKNAYKVFSFEIDKSLEERLTKLENNHENLKIIFNDIMNEGKEDIHKLVLGAGKTKYKLVANIPYYITTPIIMKFIDDEWCTDITVMVQKEVAERISSVDNSGDYGSVSAAINLIGTAKLARVVKKQNFYPVPKVDSAVLAIKLDENRDMKKASEVFKLIRSAFKNRRKKLSSNISSDYPILKEKIEEFLVSLGKTGSARAEELSPEDFLKLYDELIQN